MVKTTQDTVSTPSTDQPINQRKKQAKQEAKMMLKVEAAKRDVQKAEQKVAKDQEKLEARQTRLHQFEEQLSAIRTPAAQA